MFGKGFLSLFAKRVKTTRRRKLQRVLGRIEELESRRVFAGPGAGSGPALTLSTTSVTGVLESTSVVALGQLSDVQCNVTPTVAGADAASFQLVPTTPSHYALKFATGVVLDFESKASFSINVTASDTGGTSTQAFSLTVSNVAPTATNLSLAVVEDNSKSGSMSASDPGNSPVTYSIVSQASAHGTVTIDNAATGAFTYVPDPNFNGTAFFTYKAVDSAASPLSSNTATVTLNVSAVNDPPVASNGSLSAVEDTVATGTLVANDVDSASLTYSIVDSSNAHGTVAITNAATGAYSYTPAANYNGTASFTFKANDGSADSNIAVINITVAAVNDPPVASPGTLAAVEDTPTTGTLVATDIDSASLTFSLVTTTGAHGTVTITDAATGAYSYVPDPDYNGPASFTFKANDGSVDSNVTSINITVAAVNDPPVASNGSLSAVEDTVATGTLVANDVDNALLTYSIVDSSNAHGTVTITNAATGAYSYTPAANYNGTASFTFKANDGSADSNVAVINITVASVNDPPVIISSPSASMQENSINALTVVATDVDAGTSLVYGLAGGVDAGSFSINPTTGALTFNVAPDFEAPTDFDGNNIYLVNVSASDGLDTTVQSVQVTVTNQASFVANVGVVNGGAAQRSMLTSVTVSFGSPVTLQAGAFTLKNTDTNLTLLSNQLVVSPSSGPSTSFTITFQTAAGGNSVISRASGGNSLVDGSYLLTMNKAKASSVGFDALTTDYLFGNLGRNAGGSDHKFYRLFGDIDGNGAVDSIDYAAARTAFSSPANYNPLFDINGDGTLSASESTAFSQNFGKRRRVF